MRHFSPSTSIAIVNLSYILFIILLLTSSSANISYSQSADKMKDFLRYSSKRVTKNATPKVSAVLVECPKSSTTPSCQQKIVVNIHASSEDASSSKEKYLLLDEVFDEERHTRARLMSPYLIELSHGEPVLMYPLEFVKKVECNSCATKRSHSSDGLKQQQFAHQQGIRKSSAGLRKEGSQKAQLQSANLQNSNEKIALVDSKVDSLSNENDVILDIDIALQNQDKNMEDIPDGKTYIPTSNQATDHDNVNRNGETFIGGIKYDKEAGRSYDAIFEELEQKNEKIRKDILDILKPTFQYVRNGNYRELTPSARLKAADENIKMEANDHPGATSLLQKYNPGERSRIDQVEKDSEEDFSDDSTNYDNIDSEAQTSNIATGEKPEDEFSSIHGNHGTNLFISKKNTTPEKSIRRSNNKCRNRNKHQLIRARYTHSPKSAKSIRLSDIINNREFSGSTRKNTPGSLQEKSFHKKDTELVSHINGVEFNIDAIDNLNNSNIGRIIEFQYHGRPRRPIVRKFVNVDGPLDNADAEEFPGKKSITKIIPIGRSIPKNDLMHKIQFNPGLTQSKSSIPSSKDVKKVVGRHADLNFQNKERVVGPLLKKHKKSRNLVSQKDAKYSVFNIQTDDEVERRIGNSGLKSVMAETDEDRILRHDGQSDGSLVSEKNRPKSARENSQDGDGDDYNEEDTTNLSGFPYIVAQRPISKFPRVYQQQQQSAWLPDLAVSIESENQSPEFSEDDYNRQEELESHRKFLQRDRDRKEAPMGEDIRHAIPAYYDLNDPNLSTIDKTHYMELNDKQQQRHDSEYLSDCSEHSKQFIDMEAVDSNDALHARGRIKKRRFALYDDMEIHDTDVDSEGLSPLRHLPVFDSIQSYGQSTDKHQKRDSKITSRNSPTSVEDIWYSVFNMSAPLQFLTTRVRIFRKKENSWWKIAPSITLTSLSGIYVNANLSILFSSKTEIYNLAKPLNLQNYRLLIPNNQTINIGPDKLLAVDRHKLNLNKMDWDESIRESFCEATFNRLESKSISKRENTSERVRIMGEIISNLEDLGHFPSQINVLDQCRNDPNHLCLNMLEEGIPGYQIKVEIPFQDNALIYSDYFRVRITNIIVDATTNGAVEIFITIINEALMVQEYDIVIAHCPVIVDGQNLVHKIASPHRSVTISFLLPFQESEYKSRHKCEVQIKTTSNQTIARREMIVQPVARCLCIWECHCHCIKEFVSTLITDMCVELTNIEEEEAGFDKDEDYQFTWKVVLVCLLIFVLLLLTLGCFKACWGCCIVSIGRWKYNYLQPAKSYDEASRGRVVPGLVKITHHPPILKHTLIRCRIIFSKNTMMTRKIGMRSLCCRLYKKVEPKYGMWIATTAKKRH